MRNFRALFLYEQEPIRRFSNLHQCTFNPFMHNVEKWPNILQKSCRVNSARILKYVWPFFNIMNKGLSLNFYIWYVIEMYTIDTSRKRCLLVMLSCSIHVCFTSQELFLLISAEIQIGQNHSFLSSGPYFPIFGLNTEICGVNLRIQSKCGKIQTRKNSVLGQFSRSERTYLYPMK